MADGELRLTYRSVIARADALASSLTDELCLRRGDRIVVQLPNCWQFVVLLLGCLRAGVIPVMALPARRRHELAYLVPTIARLRRSRFPARCATSTISRWPESWPLAARPCAWC